ncbi:MAG: sigma-70 family RNA polymerase sigma factor [Verrucomicrobiota bacterium]
MPESGPDSDVDLSLVQKAQAGDLDAFDSLVAKYQPTMTGILYRFAPDRADLEDMVQDTFVRAWKGLPRWTPNQPFVHWLKRIGVNVGLEFCRKRKNSPLGRLVDPEDHPLENLATDPVAEESVRNAVETAQFILAQVPPEDRSLLTLLYLAEMPLAEIADHFGWSRANAKIKAFRARNRLKSILKKHDYKFD